MYTDVMDTIKKSLEKEYQITGNYGISIEIEDRGGYHYVISCIPKGKARHLMTEEELLNEALAYTD